MNTITALDFNFARIDLQNGLALSHRNRIRIEAYSSNGAKAVAEGSYGNRYQLTVDLRQWDEGFVGGRCDCPALPTAGIANTCMRCFKSCSA